MIVRTLLACLLGAVACHPQEQPAFRTGVSLVHVDVEVTDGNRSLAGFHKEDFLITDNRVPQHILYFSQDVEPLDLILLFDISGSMRPKIEKVAATSRRAFTELRAGDRVAVMAFNGRSNIVAPFNEDLSAVARTISNDVVGGRFGGGTRLLAAVDDAAEYFLREPRTQRRRAILILTDNYGQRSRRGSTVVHHLWEADALLSGLIIRSPGETAVKTAMLVSSPLTILIQEGMAGVAEKTGGDTLKADDTDDALRDSMRRIRSRYSLYYDMPPGNPGEQRHVKVELSPDTLSRYPTAKVRARKGYLVPGPKS
ncbi:MAG TPA: VWA domain-containing protein [Bryobacteraceae bacterium]|nr:VWA domain-containing protein [Bryobacteraceae bacterium]